jgi:serine/threonine-protein kinase
VSAGVSSATSARRNNSRTFVRRADDKNTSLEPTPLKEGTRLGRYEIRSKIGEGGMGEVYLAQDTELGRTVAVKVLSADVAADKRRMNRFVQEARAASALNHPNILTIFEIGRADGVPFIATEFIDGETLRERLRSSPLKLGDALDIAAQTAGALAAAHAASVVHRDVKPENIMLRRDHVVKVLDFGLAKLTEDRTSLNPDAPTRLLVNTDSGVVMGTAQYMSPEQARGLAVDARTDIFSLGVVLYETVAGRAPFEGATQSDVLVSILDREPPPLARFAPDVPPELERIVTKALAKDREARYQTMKDLAIDLRALKQRLEVEAEIGRTQEPRQTADAQTENATQILAASPTSSAEYVAGGIRKHQRAAVAALLVLLLAVGGISLWYFRNRSANAAQIESIAVLPFVNESGSSDVEYLSDGMTESLINNLSQLPKLNVKARSTVFRYKGKAVEPQAIAAELSVQAILSGRVVQRGDDLTLYLSLVDGRNGNQIWGEQYRRKLADLVALQGEIARDVSDKLRVKLSGADEQKLAQNYTANTEAYQLYLKGRFYWNKRTPEGFNQAADYFRQAIEKDPNYALAYTGLADCYVIRGGDQRESMPRAKEEASRALSLDPTLAEAHVSLAMAKTIYDRDWTGARAEFEEAIRLNPKYATAHQWYGILLSILGKPDEALAEINRAIELDPLSLIINTDKGRILYFARRYDDAIRQLQETLKMDADFGTAHNILGWCYAEKGLYDQAVVEMQRGIELGVAVGGALGRIGYAYARAGRRDEVLKILDQLEQRSKQSYVSPYSFAIVYAALGERDRAFSLLQRSIDEGATGQSFMKVDPVFDSLHSDPRFADLMRRVGLPQ